MPLSKVQFIPGINKEGTQYSAGPGWYDSDKVRFRKGRPEQIGGWTKSKITVTFPVDESTGEVTTSYRGVARSLFDWGTAAANRYLGIGTNLKFCVDLGGRRIIKKPIRLTTAASDVTFAATDGSSTITVTEVDHEAVAGDYVKFTDAVSLGGLITAAVLNHEYEIDTLVDADNYTIIARDADQTEVTANASDTGDGLGATYAEYQINTGTNSYTPGTGWGVGTWSSGPWGGGGSLTFASQLRLYSQDAFADDLLFNPRAGGVYFWDESDGTGTRAVPLTDTTKFPDTSNAPTAALQVMVSPVDRHVIAFGCNPLGETDIDPLLVRWSEQENVYDWTPTAINTAGGQVLSSGTSIIGAVKTRQEILIFTDTSIHAMRFAGAPFVYQFSVISENVTMVSPKAAASTGDEVYFMDLEGFYVYRGAVIPIPCLVDEYVFSRIDKSQLYKVHATNNPDDKEVTWFYQRTGQADVSDYVTYNYMDDLWTVGTFERGAWIHAPTKTYPVASSNDTVNLKTNFLYDQETGDTADGSDIGGYIESGDIELGDGERLVYMNRFISDFRIGGDVTSNAQFTVTIKGRDHPLDDLTTRATKTVIVNPSARQGQQSHVRVRAREITLRVEAVNSDYNWTMGDFRFQLKTDGRR
jgi:hypothetical protein